MQVIKDAIFDFAHEIATEVYADHKEINSEVERRMTEDGYHADDDVDMINIYVSDFIMEMINEKMK